MAIHETYTRNGSDHYIDGHLLLYHYSYPEVETPEVDSANTAEKMLGALYDLHQVEELFADGDRIETPFGNFKVVSCHVLKEEG